MVFTFVKNKQANVPCRRRLQKTIFHYPSTTCKNAGSAFKTLVMKKTFLYIALLLLGFSQKVQSQYWQWVKSASAANPSLGMGSDVEINSLCRDSKGYIYMAGGFNADSGTVHFDNYAFSAWNTNASRFLLLKYNGAGNVLWAKSTPFNANSVSTGVGAANNMMVDALDNLYVIGSYESPSIIFGNDTLWNQSLSESNTFITKYDENGNVIWATQAKNQSTPTGIGTIVTSCVNLDEQGNIYICGFFDGVCAIFDQDTIWNYNTNGNSSDLFIAKYRPNGKLAWVSHAGGPNDEGMSAICVQNGYVYTSGGSIGPYCVFGNNTFTEKYFLTKYDTAGNFIWLKGVYDGITNIKAGAHNDFYFTGEYNTYSVYGNDTLFSSIPNSVQPFNACFDSSGKIIWAKNAGIGMGGGQTLFIDKKGRLWGAGLYSDTSFICANDTLNYITNASQNATSEVYIAQYDSATGNPIKAMRIGGDNMDYVFSLLVDKDSLYVTGVFQSPVVNFGNYNVYLQLLGCRDWYFAKYVMKPTGVNDVPNKNEITVYPNPFEATLIIQCSHVQNKTFYLYDSFGKLILTKTIEANKEQINTANLAAGLYFYSIINKNGERVKAGKVVKE